MIPKKECAIYYEDVADGKYIVIESTHKRYMFKFQFAGSKSTDGTALYSFENRLDPTEVVGLMLNNIKEHMTDPVIYVDLTDLGVAPYYPPTFVLEIKPISHSEESF